VQAKCTRCSQTFQTDRYGDQFCPFCGAQVRIADPGNPSPHGAVAGAPAGGDQDQPAPIDVPAQHGGWLRAAAATWKQSLFDSMGFFDRLKPGPETGGAVGYAVAVLAVGGLFAGVFGLIQSALQQGQMNASLAQVSAQLPANARHWVQLFAGFAKPHPYMIVVTPVIAVVGFFINVALVHVALMIVGGNKKGFVGTFRALGFAQGPALFNVVPFCGSFISWIWTLVLGVIGLAKLHQVSVGRVIGAYAVLFFVTCCLCILPLSMGSALLGAKAAHAAALHAP